MKKFGIVGLLSLLVLSACSTRNDKNDSNEITTEQLSLRIGELNEKIESQDEQILVLTEQLNMPNEIYPINIDERLLYVNSLMPFAVSIDNKNDLPLVVYGENGALLIYYITDEVTQFVEAYSIKPSILIMDNNLNPEYYDKKNIVKLIDKDWAVVKIISIETSLDQATNIKIQAMLDDIKFY